MGRTPFSSSSRHGPPHPLYPPCAPEISSRLPRGRCHRILDRRWVLVECATCGQGGCTGLGDVELELKLDRRNGVEGRFFGKASGSLGDGIDDRVVRRHGGSLG